MSAAASSSTISQFSGFPEGVDGTGDTTSMLCGKNKSTRARSTSWSMKSAGSKSLVSGAASYGPHHLVKAKVIVCSAVRLGSRQ